MLSRVLSGGESKRRRRKKGQKTPDLKDCEMPTRNGTRVSHCNHCLFSTLSQGEEESAWLQVPSLSPPGVPLSPPQAEAPTAGAIWTHCGLDGRAPPAPLKERLCPTIPLKQLFWETIGAPHATTVRDGGRSLSSSRSCALNPCPPALTSLPTLGLSVPLSASAPALLFCIPPCTPVFFCTLSACAPRSTHALINSKSENTQSITQMVELGLGAPCAAAGQCELQLLPSPIPWGQQGLSLLASCKGLPRSST